MDARSIVEEDLKIMPGMGATKFVGSDAYAYYVSEVLPGRVIGLYEPRCCFDAQHPWEGGDQVVEPFNAEAKTELYLKRRYGHWWKVERDGTPLCKFTGKYVRLHFGQALSYRDPSF